MGLGEFCPHVQFAALASEGKWKCDERLCFENRASFAGGVYAMGEFLAIVFLLTRNDMHTEADGG